MKINFYFLLLFAFLSAESIYSQSLPQRIFQKNFYFDNTGLTGSSDESPAQVGDSLTYQFTYGMKNLVQHDEMFYHSFAYHENDWNIYFRTSPDGINWSDKVLITEDTSGIEQYHTGVVVTGTSVNKKIIVRWSEFQQPNPQLKCAISTDGGNSFSSPVTISNHNDNDNVEGNIVADAEGNLYASWFRKTPSNSYKDSFFSKSFDGGFTWSEQQIIFTGSQYSYPPQIVAAENGRVMVVICDDQFFKTNLVVRYSSDYGDTWLARTQITNYPTNEGVTAAFSLNIGEDNSIYAIYEYYKTGNDSNRIMISKSTDWGSTWSSLTRVSDPVNIFPVHEHHHEVNPSVAISPNGNVYAVWADQRYDIINKIWNVYLSRSTDGGETWSDDIIVNGSVETPSQYYASVAVKSDGVIDTVLVTWNDRREKPTRVESEFHPPSEFQLYQNYPNPFNPSTEISYSIPYESSVSLKLYDILGNELKTLVKKDQSAGTYRIILNSESLSAGIYLYKLQTETFVQTRKMVLLK